MLTYSRCLRAFVLLTLLTLGGAASSASAQTSPVLPRPTYTPPPKTQSGGNAEAVRTKDSIKTRDKQVEQALKSGEAARTATPPKYSDAEDYFSYALTLNAEEPRAYFGLASVYSATKIYDKAAEAYREAIRLNPKYAEAHFGLAYVYATQGEYEKAVVEYKACIELKPKMTEAQFNLGVVYITMGDREGAMQQIESLKNVDKKLADTLLEALNRQTNN